MRILYLSDVYFPRVNGVSTSIYTFRRELQALGHEVVIIAPDYPGAVSIEEAGIYRVAARDIPLDPEDRLMRSAALREFPQRMGSTAFDLVHIQTPFIAHYAGLRIARELGVPCVATYHTFFEEYLHHYIPFAPRALTRAFARKFSQHQGNQVDGLVVPSRAMLAVLTGYGIRKPMTILPTGISCKELAGGDGALFRRQHGIPDERPLLVHIGRAAFEKNIGFLLSMLPVVRRRHPEVLLVIAGEGPALPRLKQIVIERHLEANVLFVGYLDRATTLLDCFRAADVFVFASRTETQGLVLLEAMATGAPVVSVAEMGAIDILEPGRGALVAEHDEQAFAGAVCTLLESPALRRKLSEEGVLYAAEWDSSLKAQQLEDFYAGVMSTFTAGAPVPAC